MTGWSTWGAGQPSGGVRLSWRRSRFRVAFVFVVGILGVVAAASRAAEDEQGVKVEMEEVEIRGEVERPEVFYIIPRRQVRLDLGELSKDYREEILTPLIPHVFEEWVGMGRPIGGE